MWRGVLARSCLSVTSSTGTIVEPPGYWEDSSVQTSEGLEKTGRQIKTTPTACRAFILDNSLALLPEGRDGDGFVAAGRFAVLISTIGIQLRTVQGDNIITVLHPVAACTGIGCHIVISSLSRERLSLDELSLFELLRGGILLLKVSNVCVVVTLYIGMGRIGQSRGYDGEEDEGELHGNVES